MSKALDWLRVAHLMTTESVQPSWVVTAPRLQDYALRTLGERYLSIFLPLCNSKTRGQFRRAVDDAVYECVPIKSAIMFKLLLEAASVKKTNSQLASELSQAVWNTLKGTDIPLKPNDRKIILDLLRYHTELGEISDSLSKEAQPHFMLAVIDGYWSWQRMDVCATALALALGGRLPARQEVLHWCCLTIRQDLNHWQSAIFQNSPVLTQRLSSSSKAITTKELEKRLGL
jgi:hypothetical protein